MGIFDNLFSGSSKTGGDVGRTNAIDYGAQKKDGSHDHRTSKGNDRTPAQKEGDKKRRKSDD